MSSDIERALADPATRRLLRSVITDHVNVGGYPDTQGIADEAYRKGYAVALTPTASEATAIGAGEVRPWKSSEAARFVRHDFDRADRPRECQRCLYVEHDGSGIGWHPCSVTAAASPKVASDTDTAIGVRNETGWLNLARTFVEEKDWNGAYHSMRGAYLAMREAYLAAASPKPDTDTPVDPGVEGVREAFSRVLGEIEPAKRYAEQCGLEGGKLPSAVHIKLDMIAGYAREGLAALAAKPIAGMDAGEVEDA